MIKYDGMEISRVIKEGSVWSGDESWSRWGAVWSGGES